MSNTSDSDLMECEYEEESTWLFHILMTMGYSFEEIQVRRQFAKCFQLLSRAIEFSDCTMVLTGSTCYGLDGNVPRSVLLKDTDLVFVYDRHDVRYVDDIGYSSVSSDLIDLNHETINNPETFMEDIKQYPGYVRLFQIHQERKKYYSNCLSENINDAVLSYMSTEVNGPAVTHQISKFNLILDEVTCRQFKGWPVVANEWLSRERPNNWPSQEAIRVIKSQGWLVAPVGHFDSDDKDTQWRLSIKDESYLFSQLNHIQIICYVILKWILKTEMNDVAKDSICSFHVKNLMFWCAESFSWDWIRPNLLICIQKCIQKFRKCIIERKLSHYFIKERNVFNSKLTQVISKDIAKLLLKYELNILNIFELDIVNDTVNNRYLYNEDYELKHLELISVILSCFYTKKQIIDYGNTLLVCMTGKMELFNVYKRLNQYRKLYLSLKKMIPALPLVCQLKSLVDALQYALSLQSSYNGLIFEAEYFLKERLQRHLAHFVLHLAILLYRQHKYDYVIQLCLKYGGDDSITVTYYVDYPKDLQNMIINLTSPLPLCDLYIVKEHILASFYSSWEYKKPHPSSSPVACELLSRFEKYYQENYINFNVFFLKKEMKNVPDVVLFELLSGKIKTELSLTQISLSANLCHLLLLFLSYIGTHQSEEADKTLKCLEFYIDEKNLNEMKEDKRKFDVFYNQIRHSKDFYDPNNIQNDLQFEFDSNATDYRFKFTCTFFEEMHQLYNMAAYCNLKVHHYKQAVNFILKSLTTFPSCKNAAYGYLKIIIFVLKHVDVTCILVNS